MRRERGKDPGVRRTICVRGAVDEVDAVGERGVEGLVEESEG